MGTLMRSPVNPPYGSGSAKIAPPRANLRANKEMLIDWCRVPPDSPPSGMFGLWEVRRDRVPDRGTREWGALRVQTSLLRQTEATLHVGGETVMEDSEREISRHLPILMHASGKVLVSGLGLGCVVRGLIAKPEVERVDVVEIDKSILDWIGSEFCRHPKVRLHHGDALKIKWGRQKWDYAWHDIWSENESLALLHTRLLLHYQHRVRVRQGAWMLERFIKRLLPEKTL